MEWGFDYEKKGFRFISKEVENGDSKITILKNGKIVREFLFPSYKIWNIPAHDEDIIDGLNKDNDEGLKIAGSDLLGGNLYNE